MSLLPNVRWCACPAPSLQHYQYSWCVDPLDGTRGFINQTGQFTVNIALLNESRPVMGVVAVPMQVSCGVYRGKRGGWVKAEIENAGHSITVKGSFAPSCLYASAWLVLGHISSAVTGL
jgi:3'-phosphoadenosine 5'-phosphosulfate (PAPS) 3'-phosphatase